MTGDDDQGDLFDAKAAKRDGMARSEAHADRQWQDEMFDHAVAVAKLRQFFTSDDVFDHAAENGMTSTTHDYRAFGPVMLRVAKEGVCRKAKCAPINSRRATLHASPRPVWESLIWR